MSDSRAMVSEQFDDIEQQRDTTELGMWIFLMTEILLFGGLFLSYTAYRQAFPAAFKAGSHDTIYWIGTLNTAVLLISSLMMALSVHYTRHSKQGKLVLFLSLTLLLGLAFLGLKGFEYYLDYLHHDVPGVNFDFSGPNPNHVELFWVLYFFMTGLHAFHLTIGCGLVAIMLVMALRGRFSKDNYIPIVLTGLYWHFIDIVWVFLYPLIYLPGKH